MSKKRASYTKYDVPKNAPNIAITDDDDQVLLEVYRHDIIDAKTIYTLLAPRSADKIGRRLRKLHLSQFLHRLPQIEEIYVSGGGSFPMAYTLGVKGAERLKQQFGKELTMLPRRYRERSKSLKADFILHALEQTRFLVSIRRSAAKRNEVEFLYPDEIYERFAPNILQRNKFPKLVSARVQLEGYTEIEGTIPDGFFMLRYLNLPEGKNRRSIFLEIDRGTETINPGDSKIKTLKFWKDNSLLRKFVVYAYALKTKSFVQEFGIPTFQVLIVTTNPEHMKKIQKMYRERLAGKPHHVNPKRFLFTNFKTVANYQHDILPVPIEDGVGKVHSIDVSKD